MECKDVKDVILDCTNENTLIGSLKNYQPLYRQFGGLNREWQDRFLDYCLKKRTLPVTYDPFFRRIFHPDMHPERLSHLISSLLGISVKVVKMLSGEESLLDGGALLILDILVELDDGALANVEVQKIPYLFPGERMSCYSADLVLRQYSRVKREKNKQFKYGDLKKVYTIVIFEKSTSAFHKSGMGYIHKGKTVFDTGLKIELLQEYCLLALDVFREKPYPKDRSEQSAWIAFLATDSLETAQTLVADYPWLREIYEEMAAYLRRPEEVLGMFSEALRIMDQNTVQYMIEEQQEQLEEVRGQLEDARGQLEDTKGKLEDAKGELEDANNLLNSFLQVFVTECRKQGDVEESVVKRLQEKYGLSQSRAESAVRNYWS